jgi:quercetin dioxygenase-like cupin family protein
MSSSNILWHKVPRFLQRPGYRLRLSQRENIAMMEQFGACIRWYRFSIACAAAVFIAGATPAHADDHAKELAKQPGVIFAQAMEDVPGKNLVVVALEFPPSSQKRERPRNYIGHRHPGSVYVYVVKGAARLGIEGQPVQVVKAGESFFEPVGALHTVGESASATEPASLIAVLIIPDGEPILTPVEAPKQ